MTLIKAVGSLNASKLKHLVDTNPTEITIEIVQNGDEANKIVMTQSIDEFKHFEFFNGNDVVKPDTIIRFIANDVTVEIGGNDYHYWKETTRRLNKLMSCFTDAGIVASAVKNVDITLAVANLTENGLEMLKVKTGQKKEIVDFMNDELRARLIDSKFEAFVVFKFNFVDDDKLHPELWFTVEELAAKGALKLR